MSRTSVTEARLRQAIARDGRLIFAKSGGPGGQNVNAVSTQVEVRVPIEALPVAPGGGPANGPQPVLVFLMFRWATACAERWRRPETLVVGPGAMRRESGMGQCTSWPRLL